MRENRCELANAALRSLANAPHRPVENGAEKIFGSGGIGGKPVSGSFQEPFRCAGNRMQTLAYKRTFLKRRFVVRLKCSPDIPEQSSPMFACSPKMFACRFSLRCRLSCDDERDDCISRRKAATGTLVQARSERKPAWANQRFEIEVQPGVRRRLERLLGTPRHCCIGKMRNNRARAISSRLRKFDAEGCRLKSVR